MINNELYHSGKKRRSGRYPYGSGKRPHQHDGFKSNKDGFKSKKRLIDETSNFAKNVKEINTKHQRNAMNRKIDISSMSNRELNEAINRWNLEQNYTRMYNQRNVSKGRSYINRTLDVAGDVLTLGGSALSIALAIKYLNK